MAAITGTHAGQFVAVRSATAQANTGQTDWLWVPSSATSMLVYLNVTAVAGTTPILTPEFLAADPVAKDDGSVVRLGEHAAFTGITGAAQYIFQIGALTGIADDVTNAAAADSYVSLNVMLPSLLGIKLTLDRTTADETYTYNLSVQFRGGR